MRSQIYLVLIKDGRLALAVGAALEDRLLRDGHRAMALVPAVRGPEFADSDARRLLALSRPRQDPAGHGPQVVALYEDGLLADLEPLGLPAYVGVRDGGEPRVARWAGGQGAIMLPVATARDLVDAVADHTPWSRYAAGLPAAGAAAAPVVLDAHQSGRGRPPVRSRRVVTVASVAAGPLLLAGLPPVAMAVGGVSQAPALAAPASGATKFVLTADTQPAPPAAAPAAGAPAAPTGTWGDFFTNLGTTVQNYANATVTGAGNFLSQVGTGFNNVMAQSAQAQINEAQAYQALADKFVQNNAAALQAGNSWGKWAQAPGQAIGAPIGAVFGVGATAETGPVGMVVGGLTGYANGAKVGAAGGRALGFTGGYLGYQLSHLSDSSPGSTTTTPAAGTTNPILAALQAADQTGHDWVGDPLSDTKMVGEGLGYAGFTILNNMKGTQGASQAANFFSTGNTVMGSLASRFGNGWAIMNAVEYTGGFLYGLGRYVLTSDGSLQPGSSTTVNSDGSVTITSADGKTVSTITPDGTVFTTVDGNTTVMTPGGGPAVPLTDFFKSMFAAATGSPQTDSQVVVGADGSVSMIAPNGSVTVVGADGTVTTTPGGTASAGASPSDTSSLNGSPSGSAPAASGSGGSGPVADGGSGGSGSGGSGPVADGGSGGSGSGGSGPVADGGSGGSGSGGSGAAAPPAVTTAGGSSDAGNTGLPAGPVTQVGSAGGGSTGGTTMVASAGGSGGAVTGGSGGAVTGGSGGGATA
jgi:hypothetical protein